MTKNKLLNREVFAHGVLSLLILVALSACESNQKALVVERRVVTQAEIDDKKIGGQFIRIVQPQDTLYSIAFVMNLDVNHIALWNGIKDTETLLVGQRIRLTEPMGFKYPVTREQQNMPTSKSNDSRLRLAEERLPEERLGSEPVLAEDKVTPQVKTPPHQPVKEKREDTAKTRVQMTAQVEKKNARISWRWPLRGTIVERFNPSKGQQGIKIQGERGQDIEVTAAGEVVYTGNSLRGYGNLIIIKHSEDYLSAYAHNQSIAVNEGDLVKQGQKIANLGGNLVVAPISQFQIRKNGVPVDPLEYLE